VTGCTQERLIELQRKALLIEGEAVELEMKD